MRRGLFLAKENTANLFCIGEKADNFNTRYGTFVICVCLNQLGEKEHFNLKVSNNDNISLFPTFAVLMKIKEAYPCRSV